MTDSGPTGPPADPAPTGRDDRPPYVPPSGPSADQDPPPHVPPSGPWAAPASAAPGPPPSLPSDPLAPPAGPGVTPLFAAPPTEGRTVRMWIGLGIGTLALLLCCGGGTAAMIGLVVSGSQAINEQARAAAGDYFEAVSEEDYGKAYQLLCDAAKRRESAPAFVHRVDAEPEIDSYRIGDAAVTNQVVIPVQVTYAGGNRDTLRVSLAQDSQSGVFKVCSVS